MKVNILGTEYTIVTNATESEYPKITNNLGYTDFSIKQIVVRKLEPDNDSLEDLKVWERSTLRHELIHAFLFESGLDNNSWARNEEIIDWIALQFEKMLDVFKTTNALNNNCEETNVTVDINSKGLVNNIVNELNKMQINIASN